MMTAIKSSSRCLVILGIISFILTSTSCSLFPDQSIVPGAMELEEDSSLEGIVRIVQQGFREKNVALVKEHTLPALQKEYGQIFGEKLKELDRLARMMDTRKITAIYSTYAEFKLTEDGKPFHMTFRKSGGQWYLAEF